MDSFKLFLVYFVHISHFVRLYGTDNFLCSAMFAIQSAPEINLVDIVALEQLIESKYLYEGTSVR